MSANAGGRLTSENKDKYAHVDGHVLQGKRLWYVSGFVGRQLSKNEWQDQLYIAFTQSSPVECILVGEKGYFANRVAKMIAHEDAGMAEHLFAVLSGELVPDKSAKHFYPEFVLEYASYRAMCKRDDERLAEHKEETNPTHHEEPESTDGQHRHSANYWGSGYMGAQ